MARTRARARSRPERSEGRACAVVVAFAVVVAVVVSSVAPGPGRRVAGRSITTTRSRDWDRGSSAGRTRHASGGARRAVLVAIAASRVMSSHTSAWSSRAPRRHCVVFPSATRALRVTSRPERPEPGPRRRASNGSERPRGSIGGLDALPFVRPATRRPGPVATGDTRTTAKTRSRSFAALRTTTRSARQRAQDDRSLRTYAIVPMTVTSANENHCTA